MRKKKEAERYICAADCGRDCDGTLFDKHCHVCSICFDKFVEFCGHAHSSILLVLGWRETIDLFLRRMKSGLPVDKYAGQDAAKGFGCLHLPALRRGSREGGYAVRERCGKRYTKPPPMQERGEAGF